MKKHYAPYTPEMVSRITGTPQNRFPQGLRADAGTAAPGKTLAIQYALGWTQHTVGSQNIRMMAMIQLMLGNVEGMAGGGVNALRGHANVQGITDMNLVTDAGARLHGCCLPTRSRRASIWRRARRSRCVRGR